LKKTIILAILILAGSVSLYLLSASREIRTSGAFVTDVFVELKARGTEAGTAEAFYIAMDEIRDIDTRLGYRNSLVDKLNREYFLKDREVYSLIQLGREIRSASSGAFSITLRSISDSWGFTGLHPYRVPSQEEFDAWKKSPKDESVILHGDGMSIEMPEGASIDLGGLMEGYAADQACAAMRSCGIDAGLANVGGEVMAFGSRTWKVGLKNPRGEGVFAVIPLKNSAVATSGDYERFFFSGTRRYCHTLDPSTSMPASRLMSATVIAPSCTLANAWAVALFVAGPEKLGPVLEKKGFDWVVVDLKGTVRSSTAMRQYCPMKI